MKRIPCDLRLILPRTGAALIAAAWIWFYAGTVTAMRQTELVDRELQDIRIPAGKSSWIVVDGRQSGGNEGNGCRGIITAELRKSKRQRAPEEISSDLDSAKESSLPAEKQSAFEKIFLFNVAGSVVIDFLGQAIPAEFNGIFSFNEAYTLNRAEGFLKAAKVKAELQTDSTAPLALTARLSVNDTVSTSAFTIDEPIFLVPDRSGNGTLKLPRSIQAGLKSLAPRQGGGPVPALPLHLVPADQQQVAACTERLKLRAGELEREHTAAGQPVFDLKKLPFGKKAAEPKNDPPK